jgi:hypothetical protein
MFAYNVARMRRCMLMKLNLDEKPKLYRRRDHRYQEDFLEFYFELPNERMTVFMDSDRRNVLLISYLDRSDGKRYTPSTN